jgi:Zn-dependent protease
MPVLLYFATAGQFLFGYAKPVPVDFGRLRKPKQHMIWVALAGPGVNFVQAVLWGVALVVLGAAGVSEPFFIEMSKAGVLVNLVKHSAIVSVIAVFDLTTQARTIISDTFMAFEIWLTTAALYLCITVSLSLAVSALERRVRRRRW